MDPNDNMKKFNFEGKVEDLTTDQIKEFVTSFKNGQLTPFLKSQDIPETNDEAVKVIVGKNFNQIVNDETKDVLVKYYAPWCGHCKKLAPVWEKLAEELSDVPGVVIAKFDSTANEIDGLDIKGYPTLKFYPKDNKKGVDYDGERDIDTLRQWLKDKSPNYKAYLESKQEL